MTKVARHPHLAFKGMDTEEVYDVLMEHLVSAVKGYDPDYKAKVKLVVEVINNELSKRKQFAVNDVNRHLDIDSNRYLRLLVRVGFIQKEGESFSRSQTWPPAQKFFGGTPIGLAYYLQKWFRFILQEWVSRRMRELEAKEGIYSLEDWNATRTERQSDALSRPALRSSQESNRRTCVMRAILMADQVVNKEGMHFKVPGGAVQALVDFRHHLVVLDQHLRVLQ